MPFTSQLGLAARPLSLSKLAGCAAFIIAVVLSGAPTGATAAELAQEAPPCATAAANENQPSVAPSDAAAAENSETQPCFDAQHAAADAGTKTGAAVKPLITPVEAQKDLIEVIQPPNR